MQYTRPRPAAALAPVFCAALLLAGCGKSSPQAGRQMPPAQVGVETLAPQSVPLVRDLVGRLSAYRSADVRARVSGVLLKRELRGRQHGARRARCCSRSTRRR